MKSPNFKKLINVGTTPPPKIRAAHMSVMGALHQIDNIPNQDFAFRIIRPDFERYHTERRPRHLIHISAPGLFAIGIFDGHGPHGENASTLAAERMGYAIDRLVMDDNMDLEDVLRTAFRETAAALTSADCGMSSGTTASVALLRDGDLVIGNIGDSQVLLLSSPGFGRPRIRYASPMHRPTNKEEARRVEEAGGIIADGFVCDKAMINGIAVSRTLGDTDMHKYGCISEPHIQHFQLCRDDLAIVIASDGLWDHNGVEMGEIAKATIRNSRRSPKHVCRKLLAIAAKYGATKDDCTIACMTFR